MAHAVGTLPAPQVDLLELEVLRDMPGNVASVLREWTAATRAQVEAGERMEWRELSDQLGELLVEREYDIEWRWPAFDAWREYFDDHRWLPLAWSWSWMAGGTEDAGSFPREAAMLWALTASCRARAVAALGRARGEEASFLRGLRVVVDHHTGSILCREHAARECCSVDGVRVPPFYPGCRCGLVAVVA